jgi:outer membrane receptor protein involved in Fe transport
MFLVLALALAQVGSATSLSGHVVDQNGGALAGVTVSARCGGERVAAQTDTAGNYQMDKVPAARCDVTAALAGFATGRETVDPGADRAHVDFRLGLRRFAEQVVVTPLRGVAELVSHVPQSTTLIERTALDSRPYAIVTQALKEEPGVLAQQTTSSQGSPVLRGFTGQRNLYLLDGVRYNTAAWRDGPSQYLAWLPAADVDRIELVRGPASAQYGSDALGGTIGVFADPMKWSGPSRAHATALLAFGSANQLRTSDVAAGYNHDGVALRASANFGSVSDLRAGEGIDSHSALTRFLGIDSGDGDDTLEQTGFSTRSFSGTARLPAGVSRNLSLSYRRSDQDEAHRYDQEIGGNGRYRSEFGPQQLDFGFVRFESAKQPLFDAVSATVSINRQADGRLEQARPGQRIDQQVNTTTALGYSLQATRDFSPRYRTLVGAELFDESIGGSRSLLEPDGSRVVARPDIPDGTLYNSAGVFAQQGADLLDGRLSVRGGIRYGRFAFTSVKNALLGVPEQHIAVNDTTFNTGAVFAITPAVTLTGSVSRGFRAANAFDFGAIGLSGGAGFEISPHRAVELAALRGSTDGATAVTTGQPVGALNPERLMAYEAGLRWQSGRLSAAATAFDLEFHDAIERRTLIFPSSIVGLDLSGYTVIRQDDSGRAYVAGEARPIVTRVNVTRSRVRGYEAEANVGLSAALRARAWASMSPGTELDTNLPRRRMPPGMGGATLTFQRPGGGWWVDATLLAATKQDRLSDADIGDARIGASRTPASIASFFNGTAVDRGLVRNGLLTATGETLPQVQARVLGGAPLLAMFTETPGFVIVGLRGGARIGPHLQLTVIGENIGDRNYRLHGSGLDEPGINVVARLRATF